MKIFLGQECVGVGCSVDLFLFNNAYIDVATVSQVIVIYRIVFLSADIKMKDYKIGTSFVSPKGPE